MHRERLSTLSALLRTIPPEKFGMGQWSDGAHDGQHCGTVACAGGWATTIPEFREAGLKLVWYDGLLHPALGPALGSAMSFGAMEQFFGLTWGESDCIFSPGSYGRPPGEYATITPAEVADRIDSLLEREVVRGQ